MRLHRFYISEKISDKREVVVDSRELISQITRVFRLKPGDGAILFDGSGNDFQCEVIDFRKNSIYFKVNSVSLSRFMPNKNVTLCASIVKKDNFEWIVEKATELGVSKIIPIISERSEKKNLNTERLNKIVIEASEQSGRGDVPVIHKVISLEEAIKWTDENNISTVAFHVDEGDHFSVFLNKQNNQSGDIEVFIGPEGGWSDREVDMFHKHKIPIVCLGKQVLRTETAVVVALSKFLFSN